MWWRFRKFFKSFFEKNKISEHFRQELLSLRVGGLGQGGRAWELNPTADPIA